MPMIKCADCGTEISEDAPICLNCGKPNRRTVGVLLGIGIFFLAPVFAWLTLRNGYTVKARVISFAWAAAILSMTVFK